MLGQRVHTFSASPGSARLLSKVMENNSSLANVGEMRCRLACGLLFGVLGFFANLMGIKWYFIAVLVPVS